MLPFLPFVVLDVFVAPIVLQLLPVFAVLACRQQDGVIAVVQVVQGVPETTDNIYVKRGVHRQLYPYSYSSALSLRFTQSKDPAWYVLHRV